MMVFNGGQSRLDGNLDSLDFYELLKNYNDSKLRELDYENLTSKISDLQGGLVDVRMLDILIESLFRILIHDLPIKTGKICSEEFLAKKSNLLKVLFEMLSLLETPNFEDESQPNIII